MQPGTRNIGLKTAGNKEHSPENSRGQGTVIWEQGTLSRGQGTSKKGPYLIRRFKHFSGHLKIKSKFKIVTQIWCPIYISFLVRNNYAQTDIFRALKDIIEYHAKCWPV